MNTASTSGSGTLPGNTITNPKEDLKGITTWSGVAYQGPAIPSTSPPKVMNRDTEPVVDPVSALMPNQRTSIPFPSRRNDERRREKANNQIEKFYEIFKDLSFEISFTDALTLMPKFASTLKTLIGNKEKLSEMARTPLNERRMVFEGGGRRSGVTTSSRCTILSSLLLLLSGEGGLVWYGPSLGTPYANSSSDHLSVKTQAPTQGERHSSTKGDVLEGGGVSSNVTLSDSSTFLISILKDELQRTNLELDLFKEKIKLSKQFPYLVGDVVEKFFGV
ncbi:hypothetical protein Tco_0251903 [Tanacetum coccineum]